MSYLKGDCVNNAYEELRISGLTAGPTPSKSAVALRKLEQMANEFFRVDICVGYNFEDTPDLNSSAGIPPEFQGPFELCLTKKLMSIFGKGAADKIDPSLIQRQGGAYSFLSGATAMAPRIQPSGRMPVGSGNERLSWRWNRFYKPVNTAPVSCATNQMVVGDIRDFVEHFDSFLINSEIVSSYTIEANTGLTYSLDAISTDGTDIDYRVEAVGSETNNPTGLYQVKIVATTDNGRVETRLVNFELTEVDIA